MAIWGIIPAIAAAGMGLIKDGIDRRAQRKQQEKMNAQARNQQEQLNMFNQKLGMQTWKETNYEAQREQMERAGLNVGLMYGQGGGGGTTLGNYGGNVSAGQASPSGMGLQQGMALALMKAQKENIEADTKNKTAQADKTAGIDTQNAILDSDWKKIQNEIAGRSKEDILKGIELQNEKTVTEIRQGLANAHVAEETVQERIKSTELNNAKEALTMLAIKAGIVNTEANTEETRAKITKIAEEIVRMKAQTAQGERALSQTDAQIINQTMQTEFNTSTPAKIKQWTEIGVDVANMIQKTGNKTKQKSSETETVETYRDEHGGTFSEKTKKYQY